MELYQKINKALQIHHKKTYGATRSERLKKWYKYVCTNGVYEKSVKVKGVVLSDYWYSELRHRVVSEYSLKSVKERVIEVGPLAGMAIPIAYDVEGYYRIRTDGQFSYPIAGKSGIPHHTRSQVSMDFDRYLNECSRKGGDIIIRKISEKHWADVEEQKNNRIKARSEAFSINKEKRKELTRRRNARKLAKRKIQVAKNKAERDRLREIKKNQYKPSASSEKLARSYMTALMAAQEFVSVMTKEKETKPKKKQKS